MLAINNYRYSGGGGYSFYQGLPIVYQSNEGIFELLVDYLKRTKTVFLSQTATGKSSLPRRWRRPKKLPTRRLNATRPDKL